MSIKSTYGIKREVAIQAIVAHLFKATDDELSEMLEALPESRFRNYNVDGYGWSDTGCANINSIDEFYHK